MKRPNPLFILVALLAALLFSCGDKPQITDIQLKKDRLPLHIGATETLTANLLPLSASAKMVWTTSNSKVAAIEVENDKGSITKCVVTAISVGTATITVSTKDGKHSADCEITVFDIETELLTVQGGTFTMGCTDGDCHSSGNEEPAHEVTLSIFKIAKYPVTQLQWEAIMGTKPSNFKGESNPVGKVTWNDVQSFIKKLNELTGKQYRLPTEAEWEYAARGGIKSKGYKFSGSDNYDEVSWCKENSNETTHPVGLKKPNELGIYDMSGNVWEWCSDWYGAYTDLSQTNPTGPSTGEFRVLRGGSWYDITHAGRVSTRFKYRPAGWQEWIGFRLAHP